jgi:hypothetical protein
MQRPRTPLADDEPETDALFSSARKNTLHKDLAERPRHRAQKARSSGTFASN